MRKTLLSLLALALLAALPALAAPPAGAQTALAAPTTVGCQPAVTNPLAALAAAFPATPAQPEWLDLGGVAGRKFHGFCRCGCSTRPDCNTDADCGGGVGSCSQFISCC